MALSIPIASAASETSRMNGNITRVSETVSSNLPGTAWNPPLRTCVSNGETSIPSRTMPVMKTRVSVAILLAKRQADASPSTWIFLEKVVMNAVERAPSANRSRNRLGAWNAA